MSSTGLGRLSRSHRFETPEGSQAPLRDGQQFTVRLPFGIPIEVATRVTRILLTAAVFADISIALRIWLQISGIAPRGPAATIYWVSAPFIAPFRRFDTGPSIKDTGILDFPAVVAFEFFLVLAIALFLTGLPLAAVHRWIGSRGPSWTFDPGAMKRGFIRESRTVRSGWHSADTALSGAVHKTIDGLRTSWSRLNGLVRQAARSVLVKGSQVDRAIGARVDLLVTCVKMRDWPDTGASMAAAASELLALLRVWNAGVDRWEHVIWEESMRSGFELRLIAAVILDDMKDEVARLRAAGSREYAGARQRLRGTFGERLAVRRAQAGLSDPSFAHYSRREFLQKIGRGFDSAA